MRGMGIIMSRRFLFFVGVFCFLSVYTGNVSAESLVAHWKFDESYGTTAADSSGNGNHGTLHNWDVGDFSWIGGKIGNALIFDGNDSYVQVDDDPALSFGTGSFSLSLWIKTDNFGTRRILQKGTSSAPGNGCRYTIRYQQFKVYFDIDDNVTKTDLYSTNDWNGPWVHVVAVRDRATDRTYLYRDGQEDCSRDDVTNGSIDSPVPLMIGLDELGSAAECFKGIMDDIRFYDYALSQPQIEGIYNLEQETAGNPDPEHEEAGVSTIKDLGWDAGWMVSKYDVYFGTDESAVTDANTTNDPQNVYKTRTASTTYDPGMLSSATEYYWRIDSLDDSNNLLDKGSVWKFTTRATYKVLKASTAPTLDGTISAGEWDNALEVEMSDPMPLGWSTGTEAIQTTWYFMWDDNYLHVAGRMYDDTRDFLQSSPGPYNGQDTIQICFNPNDDPAHQFVEFSGVAGIYDLVAQTSDAYGPDVYRHGLADNTVPAALSSGTVHGDGWTYEGSIPWSELMVGEDTGYTPSSGDTHGLGLIIVSKKSGALTLITDFGNGHNTINTPTTWNLLALIEEPGSAYGPNPRNNAESVDFDILLSWYPGQNAVSHDVYFSDDFNDVNEGMRLTSDIDGDKIVDLSDVEALGSQIAGPPAGPYPADLDDDNDVDLIDYAIFAEDYLQECNDAAFVGTFIDNQYDTDTLEPNKTYYWCVDERAPSDTTYGAIWNFTTSPSLPAGTIIVDPNNPARMIYHATYENGRLKPVCFAGPGDPEDFFYNDTAANLSLLTSRPARCTYITAVLQDFGGGNPGSGTALDTKLDEWEGYITTLENAGVITVFFFFDDSQGLTANWQELVDKCVAKFKHHKLLIWSVAEEYGEALTQAQVSQVAARIKAQDNYNHVVGVHQNNGNSFDFAGDSNLDMFIMQLNYSTPDDLHNAVKNSNVNGTKILNMAEAADHASQTRETVRKWNWASIMGGASGVQVIWMGRASDPADWNTQDKYDDCARLMDFMESTNLNLTTCRDDLARGDTDYVLADPGNVYIVYGDAGTSLGVNILAGTYGVKWFDPVDGDWVDEGSQVLTAGDKTFTKPGAIGLEAALYLELE